MSLYMTCSNFQDSDSDFDDVPADPLARAQGDGRVWGGEGFGANKNQHHRKPEVKIDLMQRRYSATETFISPPQKQRETWHENHLRAETPDSYCISLLLP